MKHFWLVTTLCFLTAGAANASSYTSAAPATAAPVATPVSPYPMPSQQAAQAAYPMTGPEIFAGQIGAQQLLDMIKQTVQNTATYKMIAAKNDKRSVEARLDRDARLVAAKNQAEWNDNLAQSYEGLLEPQEWVEIVNKKPSASVKRKFPSVMLTAGARMKQRSEPQLQAMSTEVLQRLTAAFPYR